MEEGRRRQRIAKTSRQPIRTRRAIVVIAFSKLGISKGNFGESGTKVSSTSSFPGLRSWTNKNLTAGRVTSLVFPAVSRRYSLLGWVA